MNLLRQNFYNLNKYASYSGNKSKFQYAVRNKVTKPRVEHWLEAQDAYTLHKPVVRRYPRRFYNVRNIDDVWEIDLIDLKSLKADNDGVCYILVAIDVLSKYVWVECLVDKTSSKVTVAFSRILARSGTRFPIQLQSDRGKEFVGEPFQKMLEKRKIFFRVARNPDVKASIVERVIRTIKERLWRYMTHKNTKRYIDVLQKVVKNYNGTIHSSIKMAPVNVSLQNAAQVYANLLKRFGNEGKLKMPKYTVGDHVRISNAKGVFAKGYKGQWTKEIFEIFRVRNERYPCVYVLKDLKGEEIDGIFYEPELSRVSRKK